MFLWFIKPKGYKSMKDIHFSYDIYTPFAVIMYMMYAMWFLCIPFLFLDYSGTIGVFKIVTLLCIVADVLAKLMHPRYKYF